MSAPLQERLNEIRQRARMMLWLNGMSLMVAVLFGAALAAGFLDWLIHFDDAVIRCLFAGGIVAAVGWIGWRYLVSPLVSPLSDVELALRIERRFPRFHDSLASTVQFLQQRGDSRLGSPALQQKVIAETMAQIEDCEIDDVLEPRPVYKSVVAAVVVCLVVAVVVGVDRTAAAVAVNRLVLPFSDVQWPRETALRLLDAEFQPLDRTEHRPLQLARGETLELFVENANGPLPEDLAMQYRLGGEQTITESLQRTTLVDGAGRSREVGVVRFVPTQPSVAFRAVGGDDHTMPWQRLEVIPPAVVETLQVTLTPPAYSGQSEAVLPPGVGDVEGLAGSRVEIAAQLSKPVRTGMLHVGDEPARPLELAEDRKSFETSFVISEAGLSSYRFELVDREGFRDPEAPRYEIRGIADSVPKVYIEAPATDMNVTADAVLPLVVTAEDDLLLKALRIRFQLSSEEAGAEQVMPLPLDPESPRFVEVETEWDLSQLPLAGGMQIVFHAEAEDSFELNGETHLGQSITRTLTVVSAAEKRNELAARQNELLEQIERALETQMRSHGQVGELLLQLEKTGRLRSEDVDLAKRTQLDQQQVRSELFNPAGGVETIHRRLIDELRQNRIDDSELAGRLNQIERELSVLRDDYLPEIEQSLIRAVKQAESTRRQPEAQGVPGGESSGDTGEADLQSQPDAAEKAPRSEETGSADQPEADRRQAEQQREQADLETLPEGARSQVEALENAEENQAAAIESLQIMRRQLARWESRRDLTQELGEIVEDQQNLNRQAADLGRETLANSAAELTPQQQADLARLAQRQREQSERLQRFREELEQSADEFERTDPRTSQLLRDAAEQLDQQQTAEELRRAAEQLENNRIGEGTGRQQEALEELQQLQETLRGTGAESAESLVRQLNEAEEKLQELQQRQEQLRQQTESLSDEADSAQREARRRQIQDQQEQLRREAAAAARRLKRLRAYPPAESTEQGANQMQQAGSELQNDSAEQAAQQQRQAIKQLEQARRELSAMRRVTETRLADDLLHRIVNDLKLLAENQQEVTDRTTALRDRLEENGGRWSRGLLKDRSTLTDRQTSLAAETETLTQRAEAAPVLSLGLQGAGRLMKQAVSRLDERRVDPITIGLQAAAAGRLFDLLEAFKMDPPEGGDQEQQPPQGGNRQADQAAQQQPGLPQLIQLKMIKSIQADLLRQTAQLNAARQRKGRLSEAEQTELEEITTRQGDLANLAHTLTQEFLETLEAIDQQLEEN